MMYLLPRPTMYSLDITTTPPTTTITKTTTTAKTTTKKNIKQQQQQQQQQQNTPFPSKFIKLIKTYTLKLCLFDF